MSHCLEICAASVEDALIAERSGASRIELNAAVEVGGLTPSMGCLEMVLEHISIPVIAMVRPRPAGFCYSDREFATMMRDIEHFLRTGLNGIAFGVLDERRRIDAARCKQIVNATAPRQTVFHRAFDLVLDWKRELQVLVDCGVTRIMTSGGLGTAIQGASQIAGIVELAGQQIEIMAAGGIRPNHVVELVRQTGVVQVHAGLGTLLHDLSQSRECPISFYSDPPQADQYRQTSAEMVAIMAETLAAASGRS